MSDLWFYLRLRWRSWRLRRDKAFLELCAAARNAPPSDPPEVCGDPNGPKVRP